MAMSGEEGEAFLKLFEEMGVKPKCKTKEELQDWMAEKVKTQTAPTQLERCPARKENFPSPVIM